MNASIDDQLRADPGEAYTPSIFSFMRGLALDIEGHAVWSLGFNVEIGWVGC